MLPSKGMERESGRRAEHMRASVAGAVARAVRRVVEVSGTAAALLFADRPFQVSLLLQYQPHRLYCWAASPWA